MTDFAPDFESGFRMKYRLGKYWSGIAQMTNGWQVVRDNNNSPGFGFVKVYDKPGKFLFNYRIFARNEVHKGKKQSDVRKINHNLFGRPYLGKWIVAPMFDLGMIKDSVSNEMKYWQSYGASIRYGINDKWAWQAGMNISMTPTKSSMISSPTRQMAFKYTDLHLP
jgi:Putative beta-barrel porin-2, OmpL-like. bbp2